jgi:hypothetical protein
MQVANHFPCGTENKMNQNNEKRQKIDAGHKQPPQPPEAGTEEGVEYPKAIMVSLKWTCASERTECV